MGDILNTLAAIFSLLLTLVTQLGWLLLTLSPLVLWVAWWLWAVDWRKLSLGLKHGVWAPAVLLALIIALAWAQLVPGDYQVAEWLVVPSFLWQLSVVAGLMGIALMCGWLQGMLGWHPPEVVYLPPELHDHGEGHGHGGHDHGGHAHAEPGHDGHTHH